MTTKEVTGQNAPVGAVLAVQKIQPSGTLSYRFFEEAVRFCFQSLRERGAGNSSGHCLRIHLFGIARKPVVYAGACWQGR